MTTPPLAGLARTSPISPPRLGAPARSAPLREAVVFVAAVFLIVVATSLALPHAPGLTTPLLVMETPVFVVLLITVFGTRRGDRRALWATLGVRRLGLGSWPAAVGLAVVAVLVLPFAAALALGSARFVTGTASASAVLGASGMLLVGIGGTTVLALGEEIGWRGYLLPRVQALVSRRWAAVVVGFVHGLFHLPLILLTTTYDSVGSRWLVAPMVVITLTAAGVFYAWLKDRSGSVWPVALAHSTVNVLLDGAGLVVAVAPVALAYTAGESGIATLVVVVGLAALLLVRGSTWVAAPAGAPQRGLSTTAP